MLYYLVTAPISQFNFILHYIFEIQFKYIFHNNKIFFYVIDKNYIYNYSK